MRALAILLLLSTSASACDTYVSPDGSVIRFVAADMHGPDQAFIAKLHDENSEMCIFTAADETGGSVICSSENRYDLDTVDKDHFVFNAEPFRRECDPTEL